MLKSLNLMNSPKKGKLENSKNVEIEMKNSLLTLSYRSSMREEN